MRSLYQGARQDQSSVQECGSEDAVFLPAGDQFGHHKVVRFKADSSFWNGGRVLEYHDAVHPIGGQFRGSDPPLPSEFGAWMGELDAVARLARETARLLLLVKARAETGAEHVVRFGDDEDTGHAVAVPAPGWAPGEPEIEGAVRLERGHFLPTIDEIPKASDRAQEALGAGNLERARQWAMRSRDAREPGALRLLAEIDA